jgi:hypothetical protein
MSYMQLLEEIDSLITRLEAAEKVIELAREYVQQDPHNKGRESLDIIMDIESSLAAYDAIKGGK